MVFKLPFFGLSFFRLTVTRCYPPLPPKAREVLAGGLHLIDFEQLKIENQTHNERIEERNEALIRLKRRVRSAVQVLTHVKEKLHHMEEQHRRLTAHLARLDSALAQRRSELTYTRRARERLSEESRKLRAVSGTMETDTRNQPHRESWERRRAEENIPQRALATKKN